MTFLSVVKPLTMAMRSADMMNSDVFYRPIVYDIIIICAGRVVIILVVTACCSQQLFETYPYM